MEENPIILKLGGLVKTLYRSLRAEDFMKTDRIFLLFYWLIINSCFIVTPYLSQVITGKPVNKVPHVLNLLINHWPIPLFFFIGLFIILKFYNTNKLLGRIGLFFSLIITLYIITSNMPLYSDSYDKTKEIFSYLLRYSGMRAYFLITISTTWLLLFNFFLYSELRTDLLIKDESYNKLVHKRYLEYMHNFVWISIFGLLTFVLLYLRLIESLGAGKGIASPEGYPRAVWLMQLLFLCFLGIVLVLYAFHTKLKEIEEARF